MKNLKRTILFLIVLLASLIFNTHFCNAATTTVSSEEELINSINSASNGDTINLSSDIVVTKPVEITGKTITINGNGHTITRNDTNWTPNGNNGTLITAGLSGTKLNLINISLKNSQKYGVQSYDGAYVTLDNVTISGCGFGGVLVNAGTVEVKNLVLYKNGNPSNNGIEIAKGNGIYTETNKPILIMNGTLSSTEKDNVIYIAINDRLTEFEVKNTDNTVNKALINGNKIVVTDKNNNILYESNENPDIPITGENYVKNITLTINLMEQNVQIPLQEGSKITSEEVKSKINLQNLNLSNYTLEGFYSDAEFKSEFDFTNPIMANTTIFAKLTLNPTTDNNENNNDNNTTIEETKKPNKEKDETPKTGVKSNLGIAISVIVISTISIILLKRKNSNIY